MKHELMADSESVVIRETLQHGVSSKREWWVTVIATGMVQAAHSQCRLMCGPVEILSRIASIQDSEDAT